MPITKDLQNKKHYFIFSGKDILVSGNSNRHASVAEGEQDNNFHLRNRREVAEQATVELPDEKFFNEFISAQKDADNLLDAISETPQDYAASLLQDHNALQEKKASSGSTSFGLSTDYAFIPLREFCFKNPTLAPLACRAKGIAVWHNTYRHCPKCGALFGEDKTETALLCPACGFKLYPRIEPCVIVLIHRGDEILLVKNKHSGARFYSCIAGFIELGETALDAVRRETKEEVGLELKNIRALGTQSWPFPDQLMLAYSADYAGGELVLQEDEIAEARWFKKDALPSKDELPGQGSVAWNMLQTVGREK